MKSRWVRLPAFILWLLAAGSLAAEDRAFRLTFDPGDAARSSSIVEFEVPAETSPGRWRLTAGDGSAACWAQVAPGGHASAILPPLKPGAKATFLMKPATLDAKVEGARLLATRVGDSVQFSWGGKEIIRYAGGVVQPPGDIGPEFARGGYIHPVTTPSGKVLTDDFPPDHKHHHGIWAPWTHTEFEGHLVDFWNMGLKLGRVEYVSMDDPYTGPVCAGVRATHRFVDLTAKPQPKAVLNETWDIRVYAPAVGRQPFYIFDLIIHQECATTTPLLLPQYYYGGLGVRGTRAWDVKDNCTFLTSEGKHRGNGNETRGRWCRMSGLIDGKPASIAILDHPSNFRYPEPMRLNPKEPFFCYAPSQLGEWKIEPGKPYDARYRFVAADGEIDAQTLDQLWKDWGDPVSVKVERP